MTGLNAVIDPLLRPIRRIAAAIAGGLDISPLLILIILIELIQAGRDS